MTRVCVVSDGLPYEHGGAQLRAYRHVQQLRQTEGMDAFLLANNRGNTSIPPGTYPDYVLPLATRLKEAGGRGMISRYLCLALYLGELGTRLGSRLFSLRHQFDILHVINAASFFSLVTVPLAKNLKKPVILEMVLRGADDPLKLDARSRQAGSQVIKHRPLKYSLFLQADAYVSKSQPISDAYFNAGLPPLKLHQIPTGVDTHRYRPAHPEEKRALRLQLGLKPESQLILSVGIIHPRKGHHRLLPAFKEVLPAFPQAHLLMVGPCRDSESSYLGELKSQVSSLGLSASVTIIDRLVDNAHQYLQAADIFALLTESEGFSVAILEAMSTALPVVASDIPEIAQSQLLDGEQGILVPLEDTRRASAALVSLLQDRTLRDRLGQAARQRVLREFSLERVTSQYLSLYESLLKPVPTHA